CVWRARRLAIALGGLGPENLIHVPSAWHRRCDDAAGRCGSGFSVANLAASILIPPAVQKSLPCLAGRATPLCHGWPDRRMADLPDFLRCCSPHASVGRFEVPNPSTPTHGNADTHAVQYPF